MLTGMRLYGKSYERGDFVIQQEFPREGARPEYWIYQRHSRTPYIQRAFRTLAAARKRLAHRYGAIGLERRRARRNPAMKESTKTLLYAGGAAVGVAGVMAIILWPRKASAQGLIDATKAPLDQRVASALQNEQDPKVLHALALEAYAAGRSDLGLLLSRREVDLAALKIQAQPTSAREQIVSLPDENGINMMMQAGDLIWVNFSQQLPAGYKWTTSFEGDFVADITRANTGREVEGLPVYMVKARGTGRDRINFTAYQYDAQGNPTVNTQVIGPIGFNLSVR